MFPCRKRYEVENGTLEGIARAERKKIGTLMYGSPACDVPDCEGLSPQSGTVLDVQPSGTPETVRGVSVSEEVKIPETIDKGPEKSEESVGISYAPSGHTIYKNEGCMRLIPDPTT